MSNTDITGRAMLVRLVISFWSGRKLDRSVSQEVSTARGAEAETGRFWKHLFGGRRSATAAAHSAAANAAGRTRSLHHDQTLPWDDSGWRLLPTKNFFTYSKVMRESMSEYDKSVSAFLARYPEICEQAKKSLGRLHNPEDYPSVAELRSRFTMTVEYSPIPAKGDFRMDLSEDQRAEIEKATEDRIGRAVNLAMQDAWQRLHGVVFKVAEKLSDPDAIFRDSLLENVKEMASVLGRLNVANDPNLEQLRKRAEKEIATLDPDALRKDTTERQKAAAKAQSILAAMEGLYKR